MRETETAEVNLTNCDREPIHQLGTIQPFGALIAVNGDWLIAHKSANARDFLGLPQALEQGDPLSRHFSAEALEILSGCVAMLDGDSTVERHFGIDLRGAGQLHDVAIHQSADVVILEIERHDPDNAPHHIGLLRPLMAKLENLKDVETLCDAAAQQMKRLLGFDRVMVYRFHEDESGEVIAEAREPHLEAFLGLRYPQSDIPRQARALYVRNLFRIISDINAEPVPIEPAVSLAGKPLDLSLSTLRAVSPIHVEYLRNMGVEASLSISIVIRGKLWGLFACHHYSPRILSYSLRTVSELFSQLFSLHLDRTIANIGIGLADKGRELHDRLMSRLAGKPSLIESLDTIDKSITPVIPHDGISVYIEGLYKSRGTAPSEEEFCNLVPALNGASTGRIVASHTLSDLIPGAASFMDRVAGAMIIPVSRRPRDYIALWRRELPKVVTWAGNPEKPLEYGPNGARLTPRKSFEAWQQSVRGQSASWTDQELQVAESFRITLLEVILRVTDEAMRERAKAQEQQELLIAELNHRVRNVLNLIRGLVGQSAQETRDASELAGLIGGRIGALAMAHDNITRERWSPASLHSLINAETQAYLSQKQDRVQIIGGDVLIAPEAYTVLALVLHEMMTNSAKYGSLCDRSGAVEIRLSTRSDGDLRINWIEKGGPPVKPPRRRGFGMTIVERSIPFELKGEADIQFKLGGVEASFVIPKRLVHGNAGEITASTPIRYMSANGCSTSNAADGLPDHVLVVEDSMIIALETEQCLQELGVQKITLVSSTAAALTAMEKDMPQLAILDYNLGDETSTRIAEALKANGIPFVFATGYGDGIDELRDAGAITVLQKPYSKDDLAAVLGKLPVSEELN